MKKILIIEDDPNSALALVIRLKAHGFATAIASDAISGLSMAIRQHPDLVLLDGAIAMKVTVKNRPDLIQLDTAMPAGSGFTVAQRIQTVIPTPTPIIFLTASKRPEFRKKAEELGAVGFFEKPFEADELLATIKQALARGPAQLPGPRSAARGM